MFGGDGLAVWNGKACFVEGALPGETVEARITDDKKDWARARTVKVLEASKHRVKSPCRYYGRCGGCQYQHTSYDEELRMKESQVRELLEKVPGVAGRIRPILHGPKDYGYRRSATFHVIRSKRKSQLAYISKDNVTPLPVQNCALLDPALERVFSSFTGAKSDKVSFKLSGDGRVVSDERENFFRVSILGQTLVANSKAFFQNNWEVTGLIAQQVRSWLEALRPGLFFDLYAGIGTFSFLCAGSIKRVICLEENPFAVAALKMNREESKHPGLETLEGRVERRFEEIWKKEGSSDAAVFLDPPRQGLERELASFLATEVAAKALIYVSCDPATLARDLRVLLGGRWRLEELVPFDMFPRTKHVEAAALLYYNEGADGTA